MSQKITNKQYPIEFKKEAVALVLDQGYSVSDAAESLGITTKLLYAWKAKIENERQGTLLTGDEREELKRLRKENKELRMEKEILKNRLHSFIAHLTRNTIIGKVRTVVERLLETNNPVKKPDPGGSADPMLVAY